jgi:hypothetical protein
MQIFRNGVLRGAALLALLVLVALPSALADDTPTPFDPLEARIRPPGGFTAPDPTPSLSGEPAADAGIEPSGERVETAARIKPPSGVTAPEPGIVELLIEWLRAQARVARIE